MKTADFDYDLPPELIAQQPAPRRDASRLLVLHRTRGAWEHRRFGDLPGYLRPGDLLVLNNTRVIPARLHGHKEATGGQVELLLLEEEAPGRWDALLRAGGRRPRPGEPLVFAGGALRAELIEERELGRALVRLESSRPLLELLEEFGETPLPPYIRRTEGGGPDAEDRARYQTVYARMPGAVAAPTAGLHFTPELFAALADRGVERAEITLHVGLGTFRPVTAEDVEAHRMEAERYAISPAAAAAVHAARARGGRVVAVGSTSVRALESAAASSDTGELSPGEGRSALFIRPGYRFRAVDALLTNFHLPRSTLLMMVSAFAGTELVRSAYREAVRERYRFFSYGDAMLIL
jgi:S-adenosylmethionine:tRNA ribosyltransferase-isomerase